MLSNRTGTLPITETSLTFAGLALLVVFLAAGCAGGGNAVDSGSDNGIDGGSDGGFDDGFDRGDETGDGGDIKAGDGDAASDGGEGQLDGMDGGDLQPDGGPPCSGISGTFHGLSITVDSEQRFYYLHVPASYDCRQAWPVLFDLHGTAGMPPEEAYGLDDAVATADAQGFLLVRPRSRSSLEGQDEIFRWDQNQGDPERNRRFIRSLVDDLEKQYHLDPARLNIMGFSSGTNQTAVALADTGSPFSGYGFVGGGSWTVNSLPPGSPRLFLTTGFRDYMRPYHLNLLALAKAAGIPEDRILIRETDNGHDLYGWMYREMWPFLDSGMRPAAGSLKTGWSQEIPGTSKSLLALWELASGDLLAAGEGEVLLRRSAAGGSWSAVTLGGQTAFPGMAWTSLCLNAAGVGIAVGEGLVALSSDGGATWTHQKAIPDLGEPMLGYSWLNGMACSDQRMVGIGYWSGAASSDGASNWVDVNFQASYGVRAQGASVKKSPWGTWLAVGYWDYLGRSVDGASFSPAAFSLGADWILDTAPVSANVWVMVGEDGQIWRSTDDGQTFVGSAFAPGADLYAVAFRDVSVGLAVGRKGAALLTRDGGLNWIDCGCGLDRMLAGVRWLADGTALVVGEAGTALRFDPQACSGRLAAAVPIAGRQHTGSPLRYPALRWPFGNQ